MKMLLNRKGNRKSAMGAKRPGKVLLPLLLLFVFLAAGAFSAEDVSASTTVTLNPGDTYDFSLKSNYKKYGAFYVDINKGGAYTLKGSASNAILRIDPPKGETALVYLNGVQLTPNDEAPGTLAQREAVLIGERGGTVRLHAKEDQSTYNLFTGQGDIPAIRKDNTTTELVFTADSDNNKIVARADPEGFRTCAIGCWTPNEGILSRLNSKTTGNIRFERGTVEAWGSRSKTIRTVGYDSWDGGVGIGANGFGSVDGITISGGNIVAVAGDTGAAGIGTASGCVTGRLLAYPLLCSSAKNITIKGGKVTVKHFGKVGAEGETLSGTGASIGGGYRTDVENLVISGGTVSNAESDFLPGTGIGAGEEGNAGIRITGGDINVKAEYVGIGAYAIAETDFDIPVSEGTAAQGETDADEEGDPDSLEGKNSGWFGDVCLDITGGNIKVNSNMVCLGGGIPDSKKAYVEITGGHLDLTGGIRLSGPVIGPAIYKGKLTRISIRGGVINAHRKYHKGNVNEHIAVIGNAHHPTLSEHLNSNSIVNMIEFSGGTVQVTDEDAEGKTIVGTIGGNQGAKYNRDYTWVAITGGNICAETLDGDSTKPWSALKEQDGVRVYCQRISMNELNRQYDSRDAFPVSSGQFVLDDAKDYAYGLKDCNLFTHREQQLWFWLPENVEWGKVETKYKPFKGLNATVFSGLLRGSYLMNRDRYSFYPPIYLNLIAGEQPDPSVDGSGRVLYQDTKPDSFQAANDSGWSKLIETYNTARENGKPVLGRDGAFKKENDGVYIGNDGRWVFIGGDQVDPDVFDQAVGANLYAVTGNFDLVLHFDANVPEKTGSTLSGNMPHDAEYHNGDRITLPTDKSEGNGFSLRGYAFEGWNTKADGTGKAYASGQANIPSGDFRRSGDDPGSVTLYAQWKPIKYTVNYASEDPRLQTIPVEYTYDTPKKVAWSDELSAWGDQRGLLGGWIYAHEDGEGNDSNARYGKADKLLNFVDFDDQGAPRPRTLNAIWLPRGEIRVKVLVDGKGVSGLAADISIETQYGSIPQTIFEEDAQEQGAYKNVCATPIPTDTYMVRIKNRRLEPEEATFYYDRTKTAAYVELHAYTTTLDKPSGAVGYRLTSLALDPVDGTDAKGRPYVIAPLDYRVSIDAQCEQGFGAYGWICEGTEPEWDPEKTKQTIAVKGTSVLTPKVRANRYSVIYDPNGGEGEMEPQIFQIGTDQNLAESAYQRKGYEQGVWSDTEERWFWGTTPDGEDYGYVDKQRIPAERPLATEEGAEVKLYALWSPKRYTVTWHDPSGTYQDRREERRYDEVFRVPGSPGEREGFIFDGWRKQGDPEAKLYLPGEKEKNLCTVDGSNRVTGWNMDAVWREKVNIIMDLALDGEALSGKAADIKLTDGNHVYEGYFVEDARDAGRYVYKAIEGKTLSAGTYRVVIDGYEIPQTETFTYDPTKETLLNYDFYTIAVKKTEGIASAQIGAPGSAPADKVVALSGAQLQIKAAVEEGYRFDCWMWTNGSRPKDMDPERAEQTIRADGAVELTAHAAGNSYTVVFDPNDSAYPDTEPATGAMDDEDMIYGTAKKLSANKYRKTGYTFREWNTEPDGGGNRYGDGQSVSNLTKKDQGKVTLYAIWEAREYTITYIDPYRLCNTQRQKVKYNETVTLIDGNDPNWKPEGHTLRGWEGKALGSFYPPGRQVTNFCTVNEDGSLSGKELYAAWTSNGSVLVNITLDGAGVIVDPDDIEMFQLDSGAAYSGCFIMNSEKPGWYMYDPAARPEDAGGQLPPGDYIVHLKDCGEYGLADARAQVSCGPEISATAYLWSETVTVVKGEHVRSVSVTDPRTGASGSSVVVAHGANAGITAVVDEEGYHFDSYSISGTRPDFDPSAAEQIIQVYGAVELTAQAAGNAYAVAFDPNDSAYPGTEPATGTMDDESMTYGTAKELSANKYRKTGYTFREWNTEPDGSGDTYSDGQSVSNLTKEDQGRVTLYAIWEAREYTITYIDPYSLCNTQRQKVKYDETVTLIDGNDPNWQPAGYTLRGWEGSALGSFYPPGRQVTNFCTVNEDGSLSGKELYAAWTSNGSVLVNIALDGAGVDVDPDDIEMIQSDSGTVYSGCFTVDSEKPGWYRYDPAAPAEDAGGQLPPGEYIVHLKNCREYGLADAQAQVSCGPEISATAYLWSETVTVVMDEHVRSVSVTDPDTGASGSSVVVANGAKAGIAAVVDEEGYHFDSYAISGTRPDFDPSAAEQTIQVYGAVELTAQAAPNVYIVRYDANGGEGTLPDQYMTFDHRDTLAVNIFTREHNDFAGWNTEADGSGTAYQDGESVIDLASGEGDVVTMYAQWEAIPRFTVAFVTGGGSRVPAQSVERGETAVRPEDPKRAGYDFDDWYADKELTERFDFSTKITEDTTLYAKWNAKPARTLVAVAKAKGKRGMKFTWTKVEGASGYDIFFAKCNTSKKKHAYKLVKTVKGNKTFKWTKKGLNTKTAYKAYVKAYMMENGKKTYIAASPPIHAYSSGGSNTHTNAKDVTVNKTKVTLKENGTFKVKAKVTKLEKGKKLISTQHTAKLRYLSSDGEVATVSRTGRIKAKAEGSCRIYVLAHNGIYKKINVQVR